MTSATSDSMARTTSPVEGRSSEMMAEQAVARLGERREDLERLERSREALTVTFVTSASDHGVRLA